MIYFDIMLFYILILYLHVKEPYEHEKMLVGKIQRPCFSPVCHMLRH
jgi:hypothetical protein